MGKTYLAERKALRVGGVYLAIFAWFLFLLLAAVMQSPDDNWREVVGGITTLLSVLLVLLWLLGKFTFKWSFSIEEVRIKDREMTHRSVGRARELWLGDVTRLTWQCGDERPGVTLGTTDSVFTVPFESYLRSDGVEIIEWIRWGSPVPGENWPRFCHYVALPMRGPIDRPLRAGERRRTRRSFDRVVAAIAAVLAIGCGIAWWWTGEIVSLSPLSVIPPLWICRFLIPKQGQIIWRAPRMPYFFPMLVAIVAQMGICFGVLATLNQGRAEAAAGIALLVAAIGAITLLILFNRRQKRFTAENEPRWLAQSVAAWNAEAKSGAWALGREARSATPSARKTGG
jgi:hypothetical protein